MAKLRIKRNIIQIIIMLMDQFCCYMYFCGGEHSFPVYLRFGTEGISALIVALYTYAVVQELVFKMIPMA